MPESLRLAAGEVAVPVRHHLGAAFVDYRDGSADVTLQGGQGHALALKMVDDWCRKRGLHRDAAIAPFTVSRGVMYHYRRVPIGEGIGDGGMQARSR